MENLSLSNRELWEVIKEYSNYVTEYCTEEDITPVSFEEFYYNDYQEIPHRGDKVVINKLFVDDDDLLIWLETKGKDSYIVNEVDYYGSFSLWLDGCPYKVNPDSVEIK